MQTIQINRQRDYERFEANRRFEEMTDVAERIGYPIVTTIEYEMQDGAAYCKTDTKHRPFHEQTALAKLEGEFKFSGNQAFECTRLSHEHNEALLVDEFGEGKLGGNILIKYSKVPDAVVRGETDINGYRRDLLRHFVRIYYRTETGAGCLLFTLDKNNALGTQYAGQVLDLDTSLPSEDLLGEYNLMDVAGDPEDFAQGLMAMAIGAYDKGVYEETGLITHAGSNYIDKPDAMKAISTQTSLVDQHMKAVGDIMQLGLGASKREELLETTRQKTAAAIKLASEGYAISSSNDSAVAGEVASNDYRRECPTGNGMNQTQTMENIWTNGECQVCFAKTKVGSCMVCARCAAADDRGEDLLKLRERNLRRRQAKRAIAEKSTKQPNKEPKPTKQELIRKRYGEYAEVRNVRTFGGAREEVIHKYTKEQLDPIA